MYLPTCISPASFVSVRLIIIMFKNPPVYQYIKLRVKITKEDKKKFCLVHSLTTSQYPGVHTVI